MNVISVQWLVDLEGGTFKSFGTVAYTFTVCQKKNTKVDIVWNTDGKPFDELLIPKVCLLNSASRMSLILRATSSLSGPPIEMDVLILVAVRMDDGYLFPMGTPANKVNVTILPPFFNIAELSYGNP